MGEGKGKRSPERFPFPSPNPTPFPSKTFITDASQSLIASQADLEPSSVRFGPLGNLCKRYDIPLHGRNREGIENISEEHPVPTPYTKKGRNARIPAFPSHQGEKHTYFPQNTLYSGTVTRSAGNIENRDSITSKIFEEGGMGVRGKGGRNVLEKVSPSLPPVFFAYSVSPRSMRARVSSLPMASMNSGRPGPPITPVIATRTGCATILNFTPRLST